MTEEQKPKRTYKPLTFLDKMPFGKHSDWHLDRLVEEHPTYMLWIHEKRGEGFYHQDVVDEIAYELDKRGIKHSIKKKTADTPNEN